jgi:hypothetical protein
MDHLVRVAAANNAAWCDLVCRSHGIVPDLAEDAWTSPRRTPPLYPDAVVLDPRASADELLRRVDDTPGCSVKDSYASIDLAPHGFEVLFDAQWIVHEPDPSGPAPPPEWSVVKDATTFAAWERSWRGDDGPADVLRPSLLLERQVTVLARWLDGQVTAGAVLSEGAGVVGITSFFAPEEESESCWAGCLAAARHRYAQSPIVGYEMGHRLSLAERHGAQTIGPLRVWMRPQ